MGIQRASAVRVMIWRRLYTTHSSLEISFTIHFKSPASNKFMIFMKKGQIRNPTKSHTQCTGAAERVRANSRTHISSSSINFRMKLKRLGFLKAWALNVEREQLAYTTVFPSAHNRRHPAFTYLRGCSVQYIESRTQYAAFRSAVGCLFKII